jgi:catechol 2,3-dioxygenase
MSTTESAPQTAGQQIVEVSTPRVHNLHHVEMLTPKPEESLDFFTRVLGLQVVHQEGQSVYLRGYNEWTHHSFVLTEAAEAGCGHIGWQVAEPEHVEGWARRFTESNHEFQRVPGGTELAQGDAIRFTYPGGQTLELFYDFEPAKQIEPSKLINQPDRTPNRGVPVSRLDHVNVMAADVDASRDWLQDKLGFKLREALRGPDGDLGVWMSVTSQVHDIAVMGDQTGQNGRLHHVAFYVDTADGMLRAADIFSEEGTPVEAGPAKHGLTQAFFMYLYEPGGNRIELFNGGYAIHQPNWNPIIWKAEDVERAIIWWGSPLPEAFFTFGT